MKSELKKANREDFEEIAKIYSEEFSKTPYNEPWTLEKAIKKIELFSKYCDIWKIISDNKTVGFIVINQNQWCPGEIIFGEEMAIQKEYQGKGIGTDTFKKIFQKYAKMGFKTYMGITNKNSRASNFYEKLNVKRSQDNFIIEKELK